MTDRAGSRNQKKINMSIKERKQNLENVLSKVAGVSVEITFARKTKSVFPRLIKRCKARYNCSGG